MAQPNGSVRVALAGVGNCASALVQGVHFYRDAPDQQAVPGLMHATLGGYHVRTIRFCAAFDVSSAKVGRDLAEAIWEAPNNTYRFARDLPGTGVTVARGPTLDGLGEQLRSAITESDESAVDVARVLREARADVLVSFLPVGSQQATEFYAEQALLAGCGFINCVPVFIASDPQWRQRFEERRLPIIGDDVKSQVGATITHRMLAALFRERGLRLDRTYQLNFGGNSDFLNMLDRDRLASKKISKTRAVTSQLGHELPERDTHVGPSDYVPWLDDRKVCYIRMEASGFGQTPMHLELRLEVWDSPNCAGVVIDAIRCCKLALDRGIGGALPAPAAYFMKSPPAQMSDADAQRLTEEFINRR